MRCAYNGWDHACPTEAIQAGITQIGRMNTDLIAALRLQFSTQRMGGYEVGRGLYTALTMEEHREEEERMTQSWCSHG